MSFIKDVIGSLSGSTARDAGKDHFAAIEKGIKFTKDEIAKSRAETLPLFDLAFKNQQIGLDSTFGIPQQTLEAQLKMLGAGTAGLSPEGASNSLRAAVNSGAGALGGRVFDPLTGRTMNEKPERFTKVSATPFSNIQKPEFLNPLGGLANA